MRWQEDTTAARESGASCRSGGEGASTHAPGMVTRGGDGLVSHGIPQALDSLARVAK